MIGATSRNLIADFSHVALQAKSTVILPRLDLCRTKNSTQNHCRMLFPTSLCGVLVFGCALQSAPPPAPASNSLTDNLLTHNSLTHNSLTHTQLSHTTYSVSQAYSDPDVHSARQTWRLVTTTFTSTARAVFRPCIQGRCLWCLSIFSYSFWLSYPF